MSLSAHPVISRVYLLNTDYDCSMIAEIFADGYHQKVELAPMEIKNIKTGIIIQ